MAAALKSYWLACAAADAVILVRVLHPIGLITPSLRLKGGNATPSIKPQHQPGHPRDPSGAGHLHKHHEDEEDHETGE